ncbi:FAR1-related sequence 2 [Hibiscus trionum]|uniref:Protein FAR1-RELATED SEQUENCE n=1 Tax=Hibiscus trionum TaxID=183268 RepID=A0A9W7MHV1_HIBTR|nr:FAR1-related sequence 2 [Hibiscus trionum]
MFSLEIDLEVPSQEEEKLIPVSDENGDVMGVAEEIDAEDNDGTPPATSEHAVEACETNLMESFAGCEDHVDVTTAEADASKGAILEPQNDLEFESKEAAYSFYREYARSVGFGITIVSSRRSKRSGKFIDVKVACSRFGSKRESNTTLNPRSCPKTGCKARVHMKRRQDEKWIIHSFVKEHNHEICPDDFYYAIRGRNKQPDAVARQKKGLQLVLDGKDVGSMLDFFMCMKDENPDSFYALDFDNEKCVRSAFWVDARGRHSYSHFSDVVFFDTFFVRNKYKIPYIPIIGVNHHFQYMLLGCALIGESTTSAFVWLMRSWLKAMGGRAPKVVLTDQDKVLNEAVADVFPNSRHCFCLWHVLSKLPENLGSTMNQDENFMKKFNKCIYRSWTHEQFEERWCSMVNKFDLKEHEWVHSLYNDREKWVPIHMRHVFLAGISTAERSESVASFFDKFMRKAATFSEFIVQLKQFSLELYEMEDKADFETQNKQPLLRSVSTFEKQMSMVYTDTIFKKFQAEILGMVSCHLQKESEDEDTVIFRVDDFEERQNFLVAWSKREFDLCCLCCSFEYKGFLCKHSLLVLQMSGVSDIPCHYILKRWTKEAKIRQNLGEKSNRLHHRVQRFNDLCKRAIKLGEEGSISEEAYTIALQALEEALKYCVGVNNSGKSVFEASTLPVHGFLETEAENHWNATSKSSKKKKAYKKRKVQFESEGITTGQGSCQQMISSRSNKLDGCSVSQQEMHGMDVSSRAPTLDGYYGAQQNFQGMGQLNSISPFRGGYYSNQQNLLGLGQLHSLTARDSHYGNQQSMQGHLPFRAPAMQGFDTQEDLPDEERSLDVTHFHGIASKHLHN